MPSDRQNLASAHAFVPAIDAAARRIYDSGNLSDGPNLFAPEENPMFDAFNRLSAVSVSRRAFLKRSAGAGLVAAGLGQLPLAAHAQRPAKRVSPNERITVGGIGIGNRGTYDLGCFLEQ